MRIDPAVASYNRGMSDASVPSGCAVASRVPAQVRIACGNVRVRRGPQMGARAESNNLIHPDLVNSPGCSPPRSLTPSEGVKPIVKKDRVPPMTSQLAQVLVALDMLDNKLDVVLHKLKKLKKE